MCHNISLYASPKLSSSLVVCTALMCSPLNPPVIVVLFLDFRELIKVDKSKFSLYRVAQKRPITIELITALVIDILVKLLESIAITYKKI